MYDQWARSVLADPDLGVEPPSTVDLTRAVRDGRHITRARRVTVVAVAAGATAVVLAAVPAFLVDRDRQGPPVVTESVAPSRSAPAPPPPAPTRCTPHLLPLPTGSTDATVYSGEPSGRYLVGGGYGRIVLWDDGKLAAVPAPPGAGAVTGLVVNAAGVFAGTSATLTWVYRDGEFTTLPNPAGRYVLVGINARGDVLGTWRDNASGHPPMVWPAGDPAHPRELRAGDGQVWASAIDDDGWVVGQVTDAGAEVSSQSASARRERTHPVSWSPGGAVRELPLPSGYGPNGTARLIRNRIVVGSAQPPTSTQGFDAVLTWNLRTGTVEVLKELTYLVGGVNRHGWMSGRDANFAPVARYGDRIVALTLPHGTVVDGGGPASISDDGRTIAGSLMTGTTGSNDRELPIRWLCS